MGANLVVNKQKVSGPMQDVSNEQQPHGIFLIELLKLTLRDSL